MTRNIPYKLIDIHITHNCNLTCEGCTDFTNSGLSWMITKEEFISWIGHWNKRVTPDKFNIIGGEPTLHNNLVEFLYLARELWGQNPLITVVTNGFFVHNHPNLGNALRETNTTLDFSLHSKEKNYVNKLKDNILLMKEWRKKGIQVILRDFTEGGTGWQPAGSGPSWLRIYKGYGQNIMPYEDNDPQSSWENCFTNDAQCFQLYEGNLWKCPPITYLKEMSKKYKLSEKWDPYLKYVPLQAGCSDKELEQFWNSQCMDICSMCPSKKIFFDPEKDPLMSVSESEKYYQSKEPVT